MIQEVVKYDWKIYRLAICNNNYLYFDSCYNNVSIINIIFNIISLGGNNMTVGKKIRMKRVAKDLQVKELAERVGVTLQHMSAVENGRKTASLKLLRKVAKELDCSVLDFIEE